LVNEHIPKFISGSLSQSKIQVFVKKLRQSTKGTSLRNFPAISWSPWQKVGSSRPSLTSREQMSSSKVSIFQRTIKQSKFLIGSTIRRMIGTLCTTQMNLQGNFWCKGESRMSFLCFISFHEQRLMLKR